MDTKASNLINTVDKLYNEANAGQTAAIILRIMDPLMDQRLGTILAKFQQCPPELGPLLELRAQLLEVWRIREVLTSARKVGASASAIIEQMLQEKGATKTNGVRNPDNIPH